MKEPPSLQQGLFFFAKFTDTIMREIELVERKRSFKVTEAIKRDDRRGKYRTLYFFFFDFKMGIREKYKCYYERMGYSLERHRSHVLKWCDYQVEMDLPSKMPTRENIAGGQCSATGQRGKATVKPRWGVLAFSLLFRDNNKLFNERSWGFYEIKRVQF